MNNKLNKVTILVISLIFIAINVFLVSKDIHTLNTLPFALLVALVILFAPEQTFFLLILLTPLSVPLSEFIPGLEFDFWLPTEPLLLALLVLLILKSLQDLFFEKHLLKHPAFWAILFYLGWLIISTISSEMPVVSIKYTLVRFWFIAIFFYFSYLLFIKSERNFVKFFIFYLIGLIIVVLISINKQAASGLFDKFVAHGACNPFFTDHTSYGAALAFVIPVVVGLAVVTKSAWKKYLLIVLTLFFTIALVLSYTRAAWLSLFAGIGVWVLWFLKIRVRTVIIGIIFSVITVLTFQEEINRWLNYNQTSSSGNLQEHLHSITNIKTDDSNVERLNRWTSAIRMFRERPILGWGPGTYMFQYAPYQSSYLKTIESSNLGAKGNAHSEYLGLLAEAGIIAPISYILILAIVMYRGFRLTRQYESRRQRILIISVIVGLTTYVVHGILNNFLDMDKIAAIFWGYIAFIVAMDVKQNYMKSNPNIDISSKI